MGEFTGSERLRKVPRFFTRDGEGEWLCSQKCLLRSPPKNAASSGGQRSYWSALHFLKGTRARRTSRLPHPTGSPIVR